MSLFFRKRGRPRFLENVDVPTFGKRGRPRFQKTVSGSFLALLDHLLIDLFVKRYLKLHQPRVRLFLKSLFLKSLE